MIAQLSITKDTAAAFAYIGQFRKRPARTRRSAMSEETRLHMLARDIVMLMPALADQLVENGRRSLEMELA